MRTYFSKRIIIALGFSSVLAAVAVGIGVAQGGKAPTPLDALQKSASLYINASLAVYSPLATIAADNTFCSASDCAPSEGPAVSATEALEQLSDTPVDEANIPWTSPTLFDARFNVNTLTIRNHLIFLDNSTSTASESRIDVGDEFLTSELGYLSGQRADCATHICTITAASGASVLSFGTEKINGSTATLQATINEWQQQAVINSAGQIGPWTTASDDLNDTFTLVLSNGNWLVDSVTGTFVPGEGP